VRNKRHVIFRMLVFGILICSISKAQISISNFLEYQLGNLPGVEPKNLSTIYDQLNLSYRQDFVRIHAKVEAFRNADDKISYTSLAQRGISFSHEDLGLTIGNFYHMIGRGLLLRSYEIPGAVIEDIGLRTRYGFYRDLDGFMASYTPGFAEVYLFQARPLNNLFPPTFDNDLRRPHLLEGIETRFNVSSLTLSGSYLRDNFQSEFKEYGSVAIEAVLPLDLHIYSEYGQQFGGDNKILDLSDATAHVFYASLNGSIADVGMSFEYKDYHDFFLGYNDPPSLVKEHQYLLLNRSTHITIPLNETGWQAEMFYYFDQGHSLNLNFSESVNDLYGNRSIFQEQFAEVNYYLTDATNVKVFIDHSLETLFLIRDRYTTGFYLEPELGNLWSSSIGVEYQQFKRILGEFEHVRNYAVLLSLSKAPSFSVGMTIEKSNDSFELAEGKEEEYWLGGNVSYQYSQVHLITMFYGKRRGGNACTSGICYEILPFEGFEIRLTSLL